MKKPTRWFFAALLAGVVGVPALGPAADNPPALTVEAIAQKVADAQSAAQDVQMDLKMRLQDALSGQVQEVQGLVKLKNPDLIYAHYTKPSEQFLYINGTLAQMYQPAQNMVYRQQAADGTPVYLGVGQELKRYCSTCKVLIDGESGDEVTLRFTPKAPGGSFDKMKVTIRKKDWWPVRMEVWTPSMVTRAEFSNFKFDQGLDAQLFHFTRPKGADLVEGAIF
ncbi:MAG TPA: outer-membrane lipoprotein carrier protein LolA [bacterium]|nr:outer-membrane lipoprotein carrier protein LolA [bacterium]